MNFENSKTSDLHRLSLNLTDKIDKIELKVNDKYVGLSNLSIYIHKRKYKKAIQKQYS